MSVGEKSSKSNEVTANNFHIKFKHKKILKIQKLSPNTMLPTKATKKSIGYNIYANNNTIVPANDNQLIDTGLMMTPPQGSYIRITPRSGLAFKKKIQIDTGVIDPDYTGPRASVRTPSHRPRSEHFGYNSVRYHALSCCNDGALKSRKPRDLRQHRRWRRVARVSV